VGEFFGRLFSSDFMPHGGCYFWQPPVLWLHVISDALIAAAYYSIPLTLYTFLRRRPDLKLGGLVPMFALFIFACGTTHLISIWNVWHSAYRIEGVVKAITAAVSVVAAVASIRLAPSIMKLNTPAQLEQVNATLRAEIQARQLAEEQLLRHNEMERNASRDKLRSCFEAASQAILGVSNDGRIVLVNQRTEEMFGYSRLELLGEKLEMLLPARFAVRHAAHRHDYFKSPRVRSMGEGTDLVARRKDGSEFPIEVGLSHVETPEGPLAFGLVSDITERKKAAAEIVRMNEELRQSNAEIEQFAHVASHDLQEPLRMVTNYLQLIERRYDDRLDNDGRDFIRFAVDGAKRMKALIKDLLDFSRAGTTAASFRSVGAGSILDNALANLKTAIDESAAQISSDPLPWIMVDDILLTQVFQNLIANAIKFQKNDGPPRIHVSAQRESESWIFSVQDNGVGIDSCHLERVFRIFERLHTAEEYSGSGIGLAITRKIVERHGGRVWVQSQPGIGSTFFFSLSVDTVIATSAKGGSLS
jgi:PAS domain S-box-containing protein